MKVFLLFGALVQVLGATEYTVPVLGHGILGESFEVTMSLQLVNSNGATIMVTIETYELQENVTVSAQDVYFYQLTLNHTLHPTGSTLKNHSLNVYSDDHFGLQVITTKNGHSEGYQAIPNEKLGTEYFISSLCEFGELCQLVIASVVEDITQVYIELPPEVDEIGLCTGRETWLSNSSTTIRLRYPLLVQLETTHDLTGTRIYADKPVSVLAGSRTPNNSTKIYHVVEQLVPVSDWGTEFYVRPVGSTTYGNIVHLTSRYRRTFVSMTGYPNVELAGTGQTIKRRIDPTTEIRIHASRIIQVVLYTGFTDFSNETITRPGMTLVPAVEHYLNTYDVTCYIMDSITPTWQVQLAAPYNTSYTGIPTVSSVNHIIAYEKYMITEFRQSIGPSLTSLSTSEGAFSGIMNCNGSAIFPIGVLTKQNTECTPTEDVMHFNDGLDNDCDGEIDEDYCFENKEVKTTYSIINGEPMKSNVHVESIDGWKTIKIRIRSCSDVKLELLSYNSSNQIAGKVVISISKVSFTVYRCFPACDFSTLHNTATYLERADCNTMIPYVISRNSTHICGNIGSFYDPTCLSMRSFSVSVDHNLTELSLHGLYNNAIFNFDVYRADCGGLYSDWRCVDLVSNCWEYEDDLCTTYEDWANVYCRKFCHICTPDGVGKVFKVRVPKGENELQFFAVSENLEMAHVSNELNKVIPFHDITVMTKNGTTVTIKSTPTITSSNVRKVQVIYSDVNVHLFARTNSYFGNIIIPVYPLDALGTEYMVVSFSSQVFCDVIAGSVPANVWKISKQETVYHGYIEQSSVGRASTPDTVGTMIRSSSPVAVFCAHREGGDVHFWTQLTPLSSHGKVYVIPKLYTSNSTTNTNTVVRIVAIHANTRINIAGDFEVNSTLENRGEYHDQTLNSINNYTVSANYPISVGLLFTDLNSGRASFVMVPSVDNYADNPVMVFPFDLDNLEVSLVDDTGDSYSETYNSLQGMMYTSDMSSSYAISVLNNGSLPTVRQFQQSPHLIKDLSQDICTVTTSSPGDGLDNDCDGLVDEEEQCLTGYGSSRNDRDLDGSFGEDCSLATPVTPPVPPPTIPTCYTPPAPEVEPVHSGCWVSSCQCNCKWTESLEAYTNMSQLEKDRANLQKIAEYQKVLEINTEILSATVAERESAEDSRQSSANIGYVGIVLLTMVGGMVVFFDLTNVYRYLSNKQR